MESGEGVADRFIDFVSGADGLTLGLLVFAVVLAESFVVTDLVAPGEVGLIVAGAAAARNDTSLVLVIAAAAVGATCGDVLGYTVGRRWGADLVERWRLLRRLRPSLARARRHFDRHGAATVAAARWVGALRGVVPLVAGTAHLAPRSMFTASVPSAVAWSTAMATIGFVWGDDIADLVDRVGIGISVVVVVILAVLLVRSRRRRTFT